MKRHQLEFVASQTEHFEHGDFTNVLRACSCGCGRAKVDVLKGGWTTEMLARAYLVDTKAAR